MTDEKKENVTFPPWRNDNDYIVDQYGQTALYWQAGGKRKREARGEKE